MFRNKEGSNRKDKARCFLQVLDYSIAKQDYIFCQIGLIDRLRCCSYVSNITENGAVVLLANCNRGQRGQTVVLFRPVPPVVASFSPTTYNNVYVCMLATLHPKLCLSSSALVFPPRLELEGANLAEC